MPDQAQLDEQLERLRTRFSQLLPELLPGHRDEWVLLRSDRVVAFADTANELMDFGRRQQWCWGEFFVDRVVPESDLTFDPGHFGRL